MGVVSALWQTRERRFLPEFYFPIACGGRFEFAREMLGVCLDFKKFAAWRRRELHRIQRSPVRIRPPVKADVAQRVEHWAVSGREFPPQKKPGWCGTEILRHQWKAGPSASHSGHLFLPV